MYTLYILRCVDNTLYTGITTDLDRRVIEHNTSVRGAKYTRGRRPVTVVYVQRFRSRSTAAHAEAQIKQFSLRKKMALIESSYKHHG